MPTTITINPTSKSWHEKTDRSWSSARAAATSNLVSTTNPGRVGIIRPTDYIFYRTYMTFDMSAIPAGNSIDNIKIYLKRVDSVKATYSPIIAYAGNVEVARDPSQYGLYIGYTIGGIRVSSINIVNDTQYYSSDNFNLELYPVSPGDLLSLGIIDSNDFNNTSGGVSDLYLIDTDPAGSEPYLEVTYSPSGYTKPVMGISNFTNLNGIPSANIVSVMGVI